MSEERLCLECKKNIEHLPGVVKFCSDECTEVAALRDSVIGATIKEDSTVRKGNRVLGFILDGIFYRRLEFSSRNVPKLPPDFTVGAILPPEE